MVSSTCPDKIGTPRRCAAAASRASNCAATINRSNTGGQVVSASGFRKRGNPGHNAQQKRLIYQQFGLEWEWVRSAIMEVFGDAERRRMMRESTNVFRVLIKTLVKANIITERTRAQYAMWLDMDELAAEGDRMVGDDIADAGIAYLKDINAAKRKVVKKISD